LAAITRPAISSAAQQLATRGSEHAEAEPRQFVSGEVAIASIDALRSDRLWVEIGCKNAEHAINMRQVSPVLIELPLQFVDDASKLGALRNQAGNDMIPFGGHAALRCQ